MYTRAALLDLHERSQRNLGMLIEHCRRLDAEALDRALPGFGYATVRLQLHHLIGAQEYWIGVLQGKMLVDDDIDAYPTIDAFQEYRGRTARAAETYLRGVTDTELNVPCEVLTWQGKKRRVMPALVFVRTVTHIYQHQGQVIALCRLLGHPVPEGNDFPLE